MSPPIHPRAVSSANVSAAAPSPSNSSHSSGVITPTWNGTIPKGMMVCDTSTQALTQRTCEAYGGTTQVHDNVTMCLINVTDMRTWGRWIDDTAAKYNIAWTPPDAPLTADCVGSGGGRAGSVGVLLVVCFVALAVLSA